VDLCKGANAQRDHGGPVKLSQNVGGPGADLARWGGWP
jgi:hypothetical protein